MWYKRQPAETRSLAWIYLDKPGTILWISFAITEELMLRRFPGIFAYSAKAGSFLLAGLPCFLLRGQYTNLSCKKNSGNKENSGCCHKGSFVKCWVTADPSQFSQRYRRISDVGKRGWLLRQIKVHQWKYTARRAVCGQMDWTFVLHLRQLWKS